MSASDINSLKAASTRLETAPGPIYDLDVLESDAAQKTEHIAPSLIQQSAVASDLLRSTVTSAPSIQNPDQAISARLRDVVGPSNSLRIRNPLSDEEIDAIIKYQTSDEINPQVMRIQKKDSGLARTLLFIPQKSGKVHRYILLTSYKEKQDPELGKGAFKRVKLAVDIDTGEVYALGVVRRADQKKSEEMEFMQQVLDTNTHEPDNCFVVLRDSAMIENDPKYGKKIYFLMEYCKGGDLWSHFKKLHGYTNVARLQHVRDAAKALRQVHEAGIIHRDLKPNNFFLHENRLKLGDFGLARKKSDPNDGKLVGHSSYRAPESDRKRQYSEKSDIWSLGLIFYQILNPFCTPTIGYNAAWWNEYIEQFTTGDLLKDYPKDLRNLIKKMLDPNPDHRPNAQQVEETLDKVSAAMEEQQGLERKDEHKNS